MFRNFMKKLNHPIVDVIILVLCAGLVVLAFTKATAVVPEVKKPMISLKKVQNKVGCTQVTKTYDDRGVFLNNKAFECRLASGLMVYGENFSSLKRQAMDATEWEYYSHDYGYPAWWLGRCKGYNVMTIEGNGKVWVKQFVKKHKGCTAQKIDGRTYSRKVS